VYWYVDGANVYGFARYKSAEEKRPLNEAMAHIFPVIHHIGSQLVADQTEPSAQVQKEILKVFYAHIQVGVIVAMKISHVVFHYWLWCNY
jgi:hypothetical protein